MNLEEFETQYQARLEENLNDLQTTILLAAQLENRIHVLGRNLQNMSQIVEDFIREQKAE